MAPPTYHLILSPDAAVDLESLHQYIGKDSARAAARVVGRILDAIESLEIFPHRTVVQHRGKAMKHPVRSLAVKPYVVYFRILEEQRADRILTVRHGARRRPTFIE